MPNNENTIYREMVMDLLYRLELADELFCQATDAVMSAISIDEIGEKKKSVELLNDYSKALKVIYSDFLHLANGRHVVFPADIALWQWNEPDGETVIARTIERLHSIAEGIEASLNDSFIIEMRSEE